MREIVEKRVILIQKTFRGHRAKKYYREKKLSIVRIQAAVRGAAMRLHYLHERRAALTMQAGVRGWFARELVKEIRARLKAELARKQKEERERKEREAAEKGAKEMEDSFLEAQRQLMQVRFPSSAGLGPRDEMALLSIRDV